MAFGWSQQRQCRCEACPKRACPRRRLPYEAGATDKLVGPYTEKVATIDGRDVYTCNVGLEYPYCAWPKTRMGCVFNPSNPFFPLCFTQTAPTQPPPPPADHWQEREELLFQPYPSRSPVEPGFYVWQRTWKPVSTVPPEKVTVAPIKTKVVVTKDGVSMEVPEGIDVRTFDPTDPTTWTPETPPGTKPSGGGFSGALPYIALAVGAGLLLGLS